MYIDIIKQIDLHQQQASKYKDIQIDKFIDMQIDKYIDIQIDVQIDMYIDIIKQIDM